MRITIDRRPPGATLVSTGDAPAKAVFRWKPGAKQLGEWKFVFTATDGSAYAPRRLVFRVHVGRRAARTFRLSSRASGASRANAALLRGVAAYARPNEDSRVLARLKALTPEDVPHVLYLANGRIDGAGRYWLVPLPLLPNGTMAWIPRDSVGDFATVDTLLVIERSNFRVTLYKRGRPVFRSIVGVGEPRWPTPAGSFYVRERLTGSRIPSTATSPSARTAGRRVYRLARRRLHRRPRHESAGDPARTCLARLRQASEPLQIRRLDRLMRIGTPVTIR